MGEITGKERPVSHATYHFLSFLPYFEISLSADLLFSCSLFKGTAQAWQQTVSSLLPNNNNKKGRALYYLYCLYGMLSHEVGGISPAVMTLSHSSFSHLSITLRSYAYLFTAVWTLGSHCHSNRHRLVVLTTALATTVFFSPVCCHGNNYSSPQHLHILFCNNVWLSSPLADLESILHNTCHTSL